MKDFLGQELFVGDNVVMIKSRGADKTLEQGKITKIGLAMASVNGKSKSVSKIIKIDIILNNLQN